MQGGHTATVSEKITRCEQILAAGDRPELTPCEWCTGLAGWAGVHQTRRPPRHLRARDLGDRTAGRDPLVEPGPGRPPRDLADDRARDLAGVRPQALARRVLQDLPRSRSGREDPRPGRPVREPTGRRRPPRSAPESCTSP